MATCPVRVATKGTTSHSCGRQHQLIKMNYLQSWYRVGLIGGFVGGFFLEDFLEGSVKGSQFRPRLHAWLICLWRVFWLWPTVHATEYIIYRHFVYFFFAQLKNIFMLTFSKESELRL